MDIGLRRKVGAGLWTVGLGVAVVWSALRTTGVEGRGYGFAPSVSVASLETARVGEIPVDLHQLVGSDDVVVRLDSKLIAIERDLAEANLEAVEVEQELLALNDERRFAVGLQSAVVDRAKLRSQVSGDRALLANVNDQLELERALLAKGASSAQAVAEWERQARALRARISGAASALGTLDQATTDAGERVDIAPSATSPRVQAARRELEHAEHRLLSQDLRASIDGMVTWVYHRAGDVVPAGEPILQVRPTATGDVLAFVTPSEAVGLEPGGSASVLRATGEILSGELVSVGIGPAPIPEHLWHNPSWPEFGVPVRIALEGAIAPDEEVTVRM